MGSRKRKTPLRDPSTYEVGHCKPPTKTQFKPKQSGNLKGRPRGSRNKPKIMDAKHQPILQGILDEINRPVMVREGDKVMEVPGHIAIVRAMKVSALKGNRLAQKHLMDLNLEVEARDYETRTEELYAAIGYKQQVGAHFEEFRKNNLPEPDILPHPDDVLVDIDALSVTVAGPVTKVSIGVQTGPPIGAQKGPPFTMAQG